MTDPITHENTLAEIDELKARIATLESRNAALVEVVEIARRKLVEERDIYIDSHRVRGDRKRGLSFDEAADVAYFNQVIARIDAALAAAEAAGKGVNNAE